MTIKFVVLLVLVTLFEQSLTNDVTYSEKEIECFAKEHVYDQASDSCQKLLSLGACKAGKWFVLEKPSSTSINDKPRIRGICADLKCRDDREFYWVGTRSCVKKEDKDRLCGRSPEEELAQNVFGEGECQCKVDPPRARLNGEKKNPCYVLYSQGPCSRGKIFVISDDNDDKDIEQGVCINDPCYEETRHRRRLGSLLSNETLAAWENGTCYQLEKQGPCPENHVFKVSITDFKPTCVMLTNTIFNLEKPQDCYQDENGDCQKRINANKYQNAEKYKAELFNSVSAARKRRTIRTKDKSYDKSYNKEPEVTWFAAHYN